MILLIHAGVIAVALGLAQTLFSQRKKRGRWQGCALPVLLVGVAVVVLLSILGTIVFVDPQGQIRG